MQFAVGDLTVYACRISPDQDTVDIDQHGGSVITEAADSRTSPEWRKGLRNGDIDRGPLETNLLVQFFFFFVCGIRDRGPALAVYGICPCNFFCLVIESIVVGIDQQRIRVIGDTTNQPTLYLDAIIETIRVRILHQGEGFVSIYLIGVGEIVVI